MDDEPGRRAADPRARRHALLWFLVASIAGLALLLLVDATSQRIDDPASAVTWLYTLIGLLALAGLSMLWPLSRLWRIGGEAVRSRQFPPPGLAVVRSTPVQYGDAAGRRGRLLQLFAIVAALLVLLLPAWLAWMAMTLAGAGAGG